MTTSCAASPNFTHSIDPQLEALQLEFMMHVNNVCTPSQYNSAHNTKVVFGKLASPMIGLCSAGDDFFTITIDSEFYNKATDDIKLSLVWHELTHCVLEMRQHSSDSGSYMYYQINKTLTKNTIVEQLYNITTNKCLGEHHGY